MRHLVDLVTRRASGIRLFGLAPPRRDTPPERLEEIAARQRARLAALPVDGVIVYDLQDESSRTDQPRPFPFLPTVDPTRYAEEQLGTLAVPRIVYRCVHGLSPETFGEWLSRIGTGSGTPLAVLVGAPSGSARGKGLALSDAYALAAAKAPALLLGGVTIAERHTRRLDEHERLATKMAQGCRFFVTQAVYDSSATRSLLSDYALRMAKEGTDPVPLILTFAPCGSVRTLEFMRWLGLAFPRWVANELRHSSDFLGRSVRLCEEILADVLRYAEEKGIPLGINVESVSIRREEIDAAVELFGRLSAQLDGAQRR